MRNYRTGSLRSANCCYLLEGANRLSDLPGQPAAMGVAEAWPSRDAPTFLISTRRLESERRILSTAFNSYSKGSTVPGSPLTSHSEELWSYYFPSGNVAVPQAVASVGSLFDRQIFPITVLLEARKVQDVAGPCVNNIVRFSFVSDGHACWTINTVSTERICRLKTINALSFKVW